MVDGFQIALPDGAALDLLFGVLVDLAYKQSKSQNVQFMQRSPVFTIGGFPVLPVPVEFRVEDLLVIRGRGKSSDEGNTQKSHDEELHDWSDRRQTDGVSKFSAV